MKVKVWMNSPVITVHGDCPGDLAYRKMVENNIRRLPVVDEDGALVGMITDRDLRAVALATLDAKTPTELRELGESIVVRDVMATEVVAVSPETDIRDAAMLMHNNKFTGLPVLDGGAVVGIITVQDLMEILVAALEERKTKAS